MKLEYFGVHGRALSIRWLLHVLNVEYEDVKLDFPTFGANKAAGKYKYGQVPMFVDNDGNELYHTVSIMKWISQTQGDGSMYPTDDAMACYNIDTVIAESNAFQATSRDFSIRQMPGYLNKENRDQKFTEYITEVFPAFMKKFEERLSKSSGKFICGEKMTLADFHIAGVMFRVGLNPLFEHTLILKALLS